MDDRLLEDIGFPTDAPSMPTGFSVRFSTTNAAFGYEDFRGDWQGQMAAETVRILREVADRLERGDSPPDARIARKADLAVRDVNGNTVGSAGWM